MIKLKSGSVISQITKKIPIIHQDKLIGVIGLSIGLDQGTSLIALKAMAENGLLNELTNCFPKNFSTDTRGFNFTPREKQISSLLVMGGSAKHIANKLSMSSRTVETHIAKLKTKTQTKTKSELIEVLYKLLNG